MPKRQARKKFHVLLIIVGQIKKLAAFDAGRYAKFAQPVDCQAANSALQT